MALNSFLGFTDEMRQSVGGTQEGLTEFLKQYPSLFILDGDKVVLKGHGNSETQTNFLNTQPSLRQRDYEKEAINFFVSKLEKFGPELQIKSLLGHRSQAAPEVRLISGRHLKEFTDFLSSQTEHFIVEGDRVRLKNMLEPKINVWEFDENGCPLVGAKAKMKAIEFLTGILEQNEDVPIPLDACYKKFCERFPHFVRQEIATNPKELLLFLKLNRNIFFIRSNKVSLVRNKSVEENGSESGRSTEDGSSEGKASINFTNKTLFPLTRENVSLIHLAKSLKSAQEVVANFWRDFGVCGVAQKSGAEIAEIEPSKEKFIAVDFKIVNMGDEILSMIIVASPVRIACFDMAHNDSILLESGLKQLFESGSITKVIHGVKRASSLLVHRYGVRMQNVFDTQVAHSIIQHIKFNKSFAELRGISFLNLQRVYNPESLMLNDVIPRKLSQSQNWAQRPITDELLLSACEECHCLVVPLYQIITTELPPNCRKLFESKCLEALTPTIPSRPRSYVAANSDENIVPSHQFKQFDELSNGISNVPNGQHNGYSTHLPQRSPFVSAPISQFQTFSQFPEAGNMAPPSMHTFNTYARTFVPSDYCPPVAPLPPTNGTRVQPIPIVMKPAPKKMVTIGTQTLSTGDITILKTFEDPVENHNSNE